MATTYQATLKFRCWKEHTCVGCGGTFAYRFERTVFGRGGTEDSARESAHEAALRALERSVDAEPCPSCGLYQPDMVAQRRLPWHWWALFAFLAGWVLMVLLFATGLTEADVTLWVTAGIALVAAAWQLWAALRDPNRHLDANRQLAQRRLAEGTLQFGQVRAPSTPADDRIQAAAAAQFTPQPPDRRPVTWSPRWLMRQRLACALLLLSVVSMPAAELLRLAMGWPYNVGWSTPVVGPGDEAVAYLPAEVRAVKGYWRGKAEVVARNAEDPPVLLAASSSETAWGDRISVKASEKGSRRTPWVRLRLPDEPELAGKTMTLRIHLDLTYPRSSDAGFENVTEPHDFKAELDVASTPEAGASYQRAWWAGMIAGGAAGLLAAVLLIGAAGATRREALATRTYPMAEDEEAE